MVRETFGICVQGTVLKAASDSGDRGDQTGMRCTVAQVLASDNREVDGLQRPTGSSQSFLRCRNLEHLDGIGREGYAGYLTADLP